jgi:DNA primase
MERAMQRSVARRIDTETLKRERPLADVVASYGITLRREGTGTYRALCPFHQERTPSFWIDARDIDATHYFCFGCSASGDVITFVMEREGCSFTEACERLSASGHRPALVPTQRTPARTAGRRWEQLSTGSVEARVLDLSLQLYEQALWIDTRAQAYLRCRAVSEELARAQRLGYAAGQSLVEWLKDKTEPGRELLPVAVQLGLVLKRPHGENDALAYREFFFDRLIIPELRHGNPIWCIGRAVEDEVRPERLVQNRVPVSTTETAPTSNSTSVATRRPRPKYLGLPGVKPIMGLEHVEGRHTAFVVEGPFDLLAAIGWELPAFAICGTHFPSERMPALADALAVYGVFDPDRAGQSAAERFAPLFGSRWRPVRLPNSLDLSELAALGDAGRQMFDILVGRARAAAWQRAQAVG